METDGPLMIVDKAAHYPLLCEWWTGHGWPAVPAEILPPLGVIHAAGAAGWLYMDNGGTGVAMLEWLVTDPQAKPLAAARALSAVVQFLKGEAVRMDYRHILSTCRQASLARMLEKHGFQTTDTGMTHLLCTIWQ